VGVYIRTDITQMRFGELWHVTSSLPVFLFGCFHKLIGISPRFRHAVCHEDGIRVVSPRDVPQDALEGLAPAIEEFQRLGCRPAFYQTVPTAGNLEGFSAVLLAPDHNAIAAVTWSHVWISGRSNITSGSALTSRLHDGTFFSTTNHRRRLDTPAEFKIVRLRGATPTTLLERHRAALAEAGSPATRIETVEDAKEILTEAKRINFGFNVSRGVWVPLTPQEHARLGLPAGEDY
jgi:hypothetical protein